ncbi:endonuclease III [Candidatus Marsarchaeota archaeon]|nr:endonuclease III [Candidatus Marsarchaeota archaeon]
MKSDPRYIKLILKRLSKKYGVHPHTQLSHKNMCELFVAVFLSPQCTDVQVNKATNRLFRRFRSFHDYANADNGTLAGYLNGLNYYKTKARHLRHAAAIINDRFGGKIPRTIKELMELPGVGRKVANVILNEGYAINEGIAVDTHCARVSRRLGLTLHDNPINIEKDLLNKTPRSEWGRVSNLFIALGRDPCKAKNKECFRCILKDICPSSNAK